MKPITEFPKRALIFALASTLTFAAAPSCAKSTKAPDQLTSPIDYDWHNNANVAGQISVLERKRMASLIATHGNGSFVCSPSGFGKKSKCFARR